jgi:thioredoxin reductase
MPVDLTGGLGASLHRTEHARTFTVVIRSPSLDRGMSNDLVERITQHPRIAVRTSSQVAGVHSGSHLRSVTVRGEKGQTEELAADAAFLVIGAQWSPQASRGG